MSRNTLRLCWLFCTVHMTSCTWHHLPAAPGHLSPVPHAWNLSPQFISLFGPFSCICFFLHLCLYVTYLFMIRFPLCPLIPHACTFPPQYLSPFVLPSSSWPAYISLVCPVCLFSSYINFDSTIIVILRPRSTWVFHLTIFPASGNCLTLKPLLFNFTPNWKLFPQYPMTLWPPCNLWEVHTPAYIWNTWTMTEGQHSAWVEAIVHTPVASGNLWHLIFASGSLGLTHNSIYELTAFWFTYVTAGDPTPPITLYAQEEFLPYHQPQHHHFHQHLFLKYSTCLQPISPPQTPQPIHLNLLPIPICPPTHLLSQVPPQVPYRLPEIPSLSMWLQWLMLSTI